MCGADAGGGGDFTVAGDSGGGQTISATNTLTLRGGKNLTTVDSATDVVTFNLDSTLYSLGDIFATSTGASVYASSTIQATGNLIGYGNTLLGGTTTPWYDATLAIEQRGTSPNLIVGDTGTTTPLFMIDAKGRVAVGTTSPRALFSLDKYSGQTASTSYTVRGIDEQFKFDRAGAGTHIGNKMFITNAPTGHSNTAIGELIKLADGTSFANTVRGLEVQTHLGANTAGENSAITGFGRTFGVRGVTEGDAGGVFEPAGVIGETRGTTQGNALRAYSASLTSGTLFSLFHETSAFTGKGLLANLGQGSGSFTGEFINLQNKGKEVWSVGATGSTTIGTTTPYWTLTVAGGVCITAGSRCPATEINGGLRVDTAGVAGGDDPGDVFDVAERYPASLVMEAGDIAMVDTEATSTPKVTKAIATSTQPILIGVVSSRPALAINGSDITLAPGSEATSTKPLIALAGRVRVKVSEENGEVKKGDYISASSIAGVGRKSNDNERSIGIALEDFDTAATTTEANIKKVLVFVNLGHAQLDPTIAAGNVSMASSTISQTTGAFTPVDGSMNLDNKDIYNVRGILSSSGSWSLDEEGKLVVKKLEADEVHAKDKATVGTTDKPRGVTLFDTESGTPYCVFVKAGQVETVSGTCESNASVFEKSPAPAKKPVSSSSQKEEESPKSEEPEASPEPEAEIPVEDKDPPADEPPSAKEPEEVAEPAPDTAEPENPPVTEPEPVVVEDPPPPAAEPAPEPASEPDTAEAPPVDNTATVSEPTPAAAPPPDSTPTT